jgi:hypothetical protein
VVKFFHDIAAHVIMAQPTVTSTATYVDDAPAMRWCSFPGERLFQRVQQEVNGNPLDEYSFHAVNFHREYRVAPNKLAGWNRCVGQDDAVNGYVRQADWANNGVNINSIAGTSVTTAGGTAALTAEGRVRVAVETGNQCPTSQKSTSLELFIPLLFWYNKDVRLAVPLTIVITSY